MHHAVRVECLNLIGQLSHVTSANSDTSLVTLEEYCLDPDPRVRAVSLQGLVRRIVMPQELMLLIVVCYFDQLEKQGRDFKLSKTVYQKVCTLGSTHIHITYVTCSGKRYHFG